MTGARSHGEVVKTRHGATPWYSANFASVSSSALNRLHPVRHVSWSNGSPTILVSQETSRTSPFVYRLAYLDNRTPQGAGLDLAGSNVVFKADKPR